MAHRRLPCFCVTGLRSRRPPRAPSRPPRRCPSRPRRSATRLFAGVPRRGAVPAQTSETERPGRERSDVGNSLRQHRRYGRTPGAKPCRQAITLSTTPIAVRWLNRCLLRDSTGYRLRPYLASRWRWMASRRISPSATATTLAELVAGCSVIPVPCSLPQLADVTEIPKPVDSLPCKPLVPPDSLGVVAKLANVQGAGRSAGWSSRRDPRHLSRHRRGARPDDDS